MPESSVEAIDDFFEDCKFGLCLVDDEREGGRDMAKALGRDGAGVVAIFVLLVIGVVLG